jgi:DNA repair photolyase
VDVVTPALPKSEPASALARVRRKADEAARTLLAPLFDARPGPTGWRLVSWDSEQGICLVVGRGDRLILIELEARNDALDCYARTRLFNACARSQFTTDGALTEEERGVVDAVVRIVRAREGLIEIDPTSPARASEVREVLVDRVLMPEGGTHYYLNAYAGCMIGCSFCYVGPRAELSRRLGGAPPPAWGKWVDVKVNAPEVLAREVHELPPGLVRMSPILTDPYQPLEKHFRITRRCIEVLVAAGFGPAVLTRESRVLEDLPLLAGGRSVVGFSIPTDDDRLRRAFEPGADSIENRFTALRRCSEAGIATCVVVQPALPMNVDAFVERTARWTKVVRVDRMHFIDRVIERYEAAGIGYAASNAWQDELVHRLRSAFRQAGVALDDADDVVGQFDALVRPPGGWSRPS